MPEEIPAPITYSMETPGGCGLMGPDGEGILAVSAIEYAPQPSADRWNWLLLDTATGEQRGTFVTGFANYWQPAIEPRGFTFLEESAEMTSSLFLRTVDDQGRESARSTLPQGSYDLRAVPGGGAVLIQFQQQDSGTLHISYMRVDERGEVVVPQVLANEAASFGYPRVGVTVNGNTLVMLLNPLCRGFWLDRGGSRLGETFAVPHCGSRLEYLPVVPLADGGLVGWSNQSALFTNVYRDGEPPGPLPRWLHRPPYTMGPSIVRGGRGYALTNYGTSDLEIVTANGRSCGKLHFAQEADEPYYGFVIGRDGTVLQTTSLKTNCSYRWWPKLLK